MTEKATKAGRRNAALWEIHQAFFLLLSARNIMERAGDSDGMDDVGIAMRETAKAYDNLEKRGR